MLGFEKLGSEVLESEELDSGERELELASVSVEVQDDQLVSRATQTGLERDVVPDICTCTTIARPKSVAEIL